uniref:Uncharacterized protein n=1 Tax=Vespula pensylvanica TaxID=30213 RepID=A0A834KE56_VESPE|nr:hypothetical protein H0235_014790 [Vespula pensylvanica]
MASLGAHSVARFASKDAPEHDPFGPKQSLFTSPSLGLRPSVVLASMTNEESLTVGSSDTLKNLNDPSALLARAFSAFLSDMPNFAFA